MTTQVGRQTPKRGRPTYIYSIVSIALVLFMLGLLGLVILHAQKLSVYFKENVEIAIIFKDDFKESDIYQFQKQLEGEDYVRYTEYISKEEALKRLMEEFEGEDLNELLGFNPLYASVAMYLKHTYANIDSIMKIEAEILQNNIVKEIYYPRKELDMLNKNVKKIGVVILGISLLLLLIVITLIDNTIRLAMYSSRFLIKSMQLVGATRTFIARPFTIKSIVNGLVSAIIAVLLLVAILYFSRQQIQKLEFLQDMTKFGLLFLLITFLGVFISWVSTQRAVHKYLRMKLDNLY